MASARRMVGAVTWRAQGDHLDEVVVGKWLHVEQMDSNTYYVDLGGRVFFVVVSGDERAKRVTDRDASRFHGYAAWHQRQSDLIAEPTEALKYAKQRKGGPVAEEPLESQTGESQ